MNKNIYNYITTARSTNTREVITTELVRQGYKPSDIEEAWATVEIHPYQKHPSLQTNRTFWLTYCGVVLGWIGISLLLTLSYGGNYFPIVLVSVPVSLTSGIVLFNLKSKQTSLILRALAYSLITIPVIAFVVFVGVVIFIFVGINKNWRS